MSLKKLEEEIIKEFKKQPGYDVNALLRTEVEFFILKALSRQRQEISKMCENKKYGWTFGGSNLPDSSAEEYGWDEALSAIQDKLNS